MPQKINFVVCSRMILDADLAELTFLAGKKTGRKRRKDYQGNRNFSYKSRHLVGIALNILTKHKMT